MSGPDDKPDEPASGASEAPAASDKRYPPLPTKPKAPRQPDAFDKAGEWFLAHGALPSLGVITIVIFAIHAHIFTGNTAGDDLSFHLAESARIADCLRNFDFDFWNPSANGGYASAYYYQVLPQLASALPAALFGHHLFWFQLSVVLPHVVAPAAAYKGMRLLGATQWQALLAAFCVAFMNGESRWGAGSAGTFNVGLYTQTWALAAFPMALGYSVRWMTQAKNLAAAIAWGTFVGLCHPFAGLTLGIAVFFGWFVQFLLMPIDIGLRALAPTLRGRSSWLDHLATRWDHPVERDWIGELVRMMVLGLVLLLTAIPIWLPLLIDREGFGGFPHRVSDEVGPGFKGLGKWFLNGSILDWEPKTSGTRLMVLTAAMPIAILFARAKYLRWLWTPAIIFALLLGLGPHIGKIGDDLIPPVRFLGGMQTVLAMGIGASAIVLGTWAWKIAAKSKHAYSIRTGIAAVAAGLVVIVAVPGTRALMLRVRVIEDSVASRPNELFAINRILAKQPQGRKQAGPGAESHWWNLLAYAEHRVPATLQMGGGGLQASPNYDFLWTQRDYAKNAWLYDAPYVVYAVASSSKLPHGEIIGRTWNFEIRKLLAPGLVSPVHVTGVLPAGYRHDEPGHKKALEWVKGDGPLKDEVLAYAGSETGNRDKPAGKLIRAWRQNSGGDAADIVAELEVTRPTTFTVRESWHPRWRAYIDGEEVPVRRVTPDFPAIDVPAGKHTLEMRFERPWWMHAAWLAWPLLSLLAWWTQRRYPSFLA